MDLVRFPSTELESLRLNRQLLVTQGLTSGVIGLLLWSLGPFVSPAAGWRYFSLAGSLFCGGTALGSAVRLSKTGKALGAVERSACSVSLHKIAASQWAEQSILDNLAVSAPVETAAETMSKVETPETPGKEASTVSEEISNFPDELVVSQIVENLENGKSDSHIITEVMGMRGRKYQEGKAILECIKEAIRGQ